MRTVKRMPVVTLAIDEVVGRVEEGYYYPRYDRFRRWVACGLSVPSLGVWSA